MAFRPQHHGPRKLVLCFDGTGNKFKGDDSDSNILKIFRMLDRTACDQYHYYQPGIGTYVVSDSLSHTGMQEQIRSWWLKIKDSAIGSSFDQHVVGGYRFLMRFYSPGDDIFIFGFSRGAYIARFLAEMLDYVGLLSHGNEEMVFFAWRAFAQWQSRRASTSKHGVHKEREMYAFLKGFRETFSRPVRRIRFLGLFDTVNSVPRFETAWMQRSKFPYTARTSAKVVRHAVSIDERRAKFRQDLMYQRLQTPHHGDRLKKHQQAGDNVKYRGRPSLPIFKAITAEIENRGRRATLAVPGDLETAPFRPRSRSSRSRSRTTNASVLSPGAESAMEHHQLLPVWDEDQWSDEDETGQDIDEVWFSGGHGDVGGGWECEPGVKSASHVPLAWMIREAMKAGLSFDIQRVQEMGCMDAYEEEATDNAEPQRAAEGRRSGPEIPDIFVRSPSSMNLDRTATPTSPHVMFKTPDFGGNRQPNQSESEINDFAQTNGNTEQQQNKGPLSAFHKTMHEAHVSRIHDSLQFDCGMSFFSVFTWKLMEYMPFRRMDLQPDGSWKPIRWPLPCGEVRDIPDNVRVHGSVIRRMQRDESYRPGNLIVGGGGRGVRVAPEHYGIGEWVCVEEEGDPVGEIWMKRGHEGRQT